MKQFYDFIVEQRKPSLMKSNNKMFDVTTSYGEKIDGFYTSISIGKEQDKIKFYAAAWHDGKQWHEGLPKKTEKEAVDDIKKMISKELRK